MSSDPSRPAGAAPARPWEVPRWPLWSLPRQLLTSILLVEATAIGLIVLLSLHQGAAGHTDLLRAGLLAGLALAHTETALRIERVRRRLQTPHHIDLSSVWIFAGAVLLPAYLVTALVLLVQAHIWWRTGRPHVPYYRNLYTATTMVLAALAASAVLRADAGSDGLPGQAELLVLVLAILVYTTVNAALVAVAIALSSPQPKLSTLVGDWNDNLLELATLSLGALVAVALRLNPLIVLLVLPPVLVLHRAVLVRYLEEAASTDGKTGLLNAATWHVRAENELRRATREAVTRAVLVLDLDHFKEVNDHHGHLAGDRVLAAVADALRAEVRDRDLVGRFGGEEFVVLLAGLEGGAETDLEAVAERIRRRVAALRVEIPTADGPLTIAGLSVSVGGAIHPGGGGDLTALLRIADTALYSAKRAGRNRVRMGLAGPDAPALDAVTGGSDAR